MHFSRILCLGLTLTSALALLEVAAHPAAAQELTATLTGVTFSDGAIATGYFNYDPTNQTLGSFDITTTNGVTDTLTGGHYAPSTVTATSYDSTFIFTTSQLPPAFTYNYLLLGTSTHITSTGVYSLFLGTDVSATGFSGSGEFSPAGGDARGVTAGTLTVTPAAVPEASTTASFGLLLALGMGGVVIAKKEASASARKASATA